MNKPYTLHIRLTHACNASCSYCSSWKKVNQAAMSPASLGTSLDFIEKVWAELGIEPTFLNIEYVGGEILLVSPDDLVLMVEETRSRFISKGISVRDGAQSNLLGSERRVQNLYDLFEGRVGTSIDRFSGQRLLGSTKNGANRYRNFQIHVESSYDSVIKRIPPAVLALDSKTIPFLEQELSLARLERRDITLRPIFQGGSEISSVSPEEMGNVMVDAFEWWFFKGMPFHLEPFNNLLVRRCNEELIEDNGFCAWQADCSDKSMSIEPNGDLYVCQELADMNELRLGNAISGEFDRPLFERIRIRKERLDAGCFDCPYFKSCQGGCLQQALEGGSGIYGKTQWCSAWKMLFAAMDEAIEKTGPERVIARLKTVFGK